jgi:hypothetical protein
MRHFLFAVPVLLALAACADPTRDLEQPTEPMGDFRLGHVGVVAPNLQKLLVSRDVSQDEWIAEMEQALGGRFSRFDGGKYYHLGVSVEAYSLPPPIIPGKSAVAMNVTVWDDAAQAKLNPEPKVIQVIKVFESRISKNRDEQLTGLAQEAAREVENWLRDMQQTEGWFTGSAQERAATGAVAEEGLSADPEAVTTPQSQAVVVPPEVLGLTRAAALGTTAQRPGLSE